jgi:hypothetical protein
MPPRAVLVAGGGLVLAAGIAIGAVAFGGDGEEGPGGATSTTTSVETTSTTADEAGAAPLPTVPTVGLDGTALELAEALNRAHQLTYHATYEVVGEASANVVVDIWKQPPLARRDTRTGAGDKVLHVSEYRTMENPHVGCVRGRAGAESEALCVLAPAEGVDPADPIIGVIDPSAGPVTARDETVAGEAARCFSAPAEEPGLTAVACFDAEGIPVAIDGGDGRLERVALERGVSNEDFVPPSAPSPAAPAGRSTPFGSVRAPVPGSGLRP